MSENTAYDPSAPEGSAPSGGQYMSKKDFKWMIIATVIVLIGLYPVYIHMRNKAWRSTCTKNMGGIMEAMMVYSSDNDGRLPPAFEANRQGEPEVDQNGLAITWVSLVSQYKSDKVSFVCPASEEIEKAYSRSIDGLEKVPSTYGYYGIYGGQSLELVDDPDSVILLAETSNNGALGTFNPLPFSNTKNDGVVIGWNDSNLEPSEQTTSVTRLAFRDSSTGIFENKIGRHEATVNAITASRQRRVIGSSDARTQYSRSKFTLTGYWREPLIRR